jgi:hypothetical protein
VTSASPLPRYQQSLAAATRNHARFQRLDRRWVAAKIILFLVLVVASLAVLHSAPRFSFALTLLIVAIIVTFVLHERTLICLRRSERLMRFYEQAMARLEDRWPSTGASGERFLDHSHLYARDLDLFGSGSLFELLSICRTRSGEETLAHWLLTPAPVEVIEQRQSAVKDLAPRFDFREAMALAGEEMQVAVHPEKVIGWCEAPSTLSKLFRYLVAPLLSLLWIAVIVFWFVEYARTGIAGSPLWIIAVSILNYGVRYLFGKSSESAADRVEEAVTARDLNLLTAVFSLIERESFGSERLAAVQASLRVHECLASEALRRLQRRLVWLESRHNMVLRFFAPFLFTTTFFVSPIERWREQYGRHVHAWLTAAGEMEALLSLSCYAAEHPQATFPVMTPEIPTFHATALTHPLLPASRAVPNDVRLDARLQLIVLSGPNMAGKSTLLRAIGLNAVLAQAGAPVCAAQLTLSPLAVAASICVLDSLQGGLSRFYAEIQRLKQMQDRAQSTPGVLFLLDELLSGTNSNDRRTGTEAVVRTLLRHAAIGIVTTHDLALTQIVDQLNHQPGNQLEGQPGGKAANYHFGDRFHSGQIHFDYRMTPGIVESTNALDLMRAVGLDV